MVNAMKRGKPRISRTQQYVGETRQDKYWTQWAERRRLATQAEPEENCLVCSDASNTCGCAKRLK